MKEREFQQDPLARFPREDQCCIEIHEKWLAKNDWAVHPRDPKVACAHNGFPNLYGYVLCDSNQLTGLVSNTIHGRAKIDARAELEFRRLCVRDQIKLGAGVH